MPFETFIHYVHPHSPPPLKEKRDLDSLSNCQKRSLINTESSWQIIQIRKKNGRGGGGRGGVCGMGEGAGGGGRGGVVVVSEFGRGVVVSDFF